MDAEAAKLIGAGLAAIGAGLAAGGVGNVFGSFLQGALRNPAAADSHRCITTDQLIGPRFTPGPPSIKAGYQCLKLPKFLRLMSARPSGC
jgi:hypothetical protein